jgi:4-hydroxybenzoate polyprenyltransferase
MPWIKAFRLAEVLLMTGFFIIGSFFAITEWSGPIAFRLLAVCLISFFTILSIYSYNSAAGKAVDEYNIRLDSLRSFSSKFYVIFGSVFLLLALIIAFFISWWFILLNLLVFGIWVLYSHPKWGLKHTAYWGTLLHFVAQIIHFNMFYCAFKPLDVYSLTLSFYFAFAFAAGHLNHEIIDHDSDLRAGVKNTATKKGVRFVSAAIILLCLINVLLVTAAFFATIVDPVSGLLLLLPVVIHLLLYFIYVLRIKQFALKIRSVYRGVYFLSFLLLILYRIFETVL